MCVRKTPLAEVFHSSPRQRRQKISCWRVVDGTRRFFVRGEWQASWEPQEEGMMSIAASFPSVKKPRFIVQEKRDNATEGDAC
jgi:hypothetical protein